MLQQNKFDVFENKNYIVNFKFKNYKNDFYNVFDESKFKN